MKSQSTTTTTYTSDDNKSLAFVVENTERQFTPAEGYTAQETVTISVTLVIDGKKFNFPVNKNILMQIESLCSEARYYANIQTESEAKAAAEESHERSQRYYAEQAAKKAAAALADNNANA
jgi:hypothetical protein